MVPKSEPAIVTLVPTPPVAGVTLEIVGDATVKTVVFDQTPACCTCAVPVLEFAATVATICVSFQLTTLARVLPNQARLLPWVDPKPEPEIVTCVPLTPLEGATERTLQGSTNGRPTLAMPFTVTTIFPLVAPTGTLTWIRPALQTAATPELVPLKVTVLVPWLVPKPLPLMLTKAPTVPELTER